MVGLALRVLGEAREAEARIRAALATLAGVGATVERGVTELCLAELVNDRGDRAEAAIHLRAALASFRALGLERFASRAEELARAWELAL